MASFSPEDKAALRYHLGYPDIDAVAGVVSDVLIVHPYQTKLEFAMDHVTSTAIPRIQRLMTILDATEQQFFEANERLQVTKADVVVTNPTEHLDLQLAYNYWRGRICNLLNVQPNPLPADGSRRGINARVAR